MSSLARSSSPKLIIVSGPPGAGKTTLAKRLGKELNIITLSRDTFKELIYDASPEINWKEEPYLNALRKASYQLLFHLAAETLRTGTSVIIESNFKAEYDIDTLLSMARDYHAEITEIHCAAPIATLSQRVKDRVASGTRHDVHIDVTNTGDELNESYKHQYLTVQSYRLGIGNVIDIDTSDFSTVNHQRIVNEISQN